MTKNEKRKEKTKMTAKKQQQTTETTQILKAQKSVNFISTSELLTKWIEEKTQNKNFALSNYIKESLNICYGQNKENNAILKYDNILIAILIDKCSYMLKSQTGIDTIFDLKNKQIIFENLQEIENILSVRQKHKYNEYYSCKFELSQEEITKDKFLQNAIKQNELNEKQNIFDAYGIPIELAQY